MQNSVVAKILDFEIQIQCQSDVLSESLVIMVNSTAYNVTPPSLNSMFINATINQTGYDVAVQCMWSVNETMFQRKTILNGKHNAIVFYLINF